MGQFVRQLILLFGNISPEAVNDGIYYLRICCGINSLIYAVMYTLDSFAIGAGAANIAMVNALLDAAIVRLPVSWFFAFTLNLGFPGVYYGQALIAQFSFISHPHLIHFLISCS